ncbi:MAG: hypothetical protein ACJA0V_002503, partial [Planctomycetota bacterium]
RLITVDVACERDEEQLQWENGGHMGRLPALQRLSSLPVGKRDPISG